MTTDTLKALRPSLAVYESLARRTQIPDPDHNEPDTPRQIDDYTHLAEVVEDTLEHVDRHNADTKHRLRCVVVFAKGSDVVAGYELPCLYDPEGDEMPWCSGHLEYVCGVLGATKAVVALVPVGSQEFPSDIREWLTDASDAISPSGCDLVDVVMVDCMRGNDYPSTIGLLQLYKRP